MATRPPSEGEDQAGPLPVLLVVDVEPDEFFAPRDPTLRWRGFERGLSWMAGLRALLATATGRAVRFCWGFRLDAQIQGIYGRADWPLREYAEAVQEFLLQGDTLGVHTHLYRWAGTGDWLVDQGSPDWVAHNLRLGLDAFGERLGAVPAFHRFGDRWMSNEAMALLDRLGIPVDMTLEPGQSEAPTYHPGHDFTGRIPSHRGVPAHPYRPCAGDFRRPDAADRTRLVEIPATTAPLRPLASLVRRPTPRNARAWLRYAIAPRFEVAALYHEARRFRSLIDGALAQGARQLVLPVRTDSFSKGLADGHLDRVVSQLLEHPLAARFEFTTPQGLLRRVAPQLAAPLPQRDQPPQLRASATAARNGLRL
jgi:hypothetical protein